tara:strand:- start:44 stop:370 length:327 start_codon:yes stop_codon:yes gene_type:complete
MRQKIEIPAKITKNMYVSVGIGRFTYGAIRVSDDSPIDTDPDFARVLLTEFELEIDIPKTDLDFKKELVAILENKKTGIKAKYHMKLKEVQEEIDNLLAIEHQPGETK